MGDKPQEAVSSALKCPQIASPCLELSPTLPKASSLILTLVGLAQGHPSGWCQ